jgi:hypothetical protein
MTGRPLSARNVTFAVCPSGMSSGASQRLHTTLPSSSCSTLAVVSPRDRYHPPRIIVRRSVRHKGRDLSWTRENALALSRTEGEPGHFPYEVRGIGPSAEGLRASALSPWCFSRGVVVTTVRIIHASGGSPPDSLS